MTGPVPASTYRLQVTADFDLHAVADLVPYLHELGVDWLYLSPLLAAEPGSAHGYDVVAHDRIDPSRGGSAGLEAVSAAAREHNMGVLVDIVPNHVGVANPREGSWWWDLLQHGRNSVHAAAFDVDWAAGGGRVRIPVVGDDDLPDPDGPVGNLRVEVGELVYHDHRFPIAPGTGEDGDANAVHDRQHYRLVSWHAADDQLNYRRFFAVNELAAVRVEDRDVFEQSHVEVGRWFRDGLVDGLRVDHPDGLRHPGGYLRDLADLTGEAYVLVEKILSLSEDGGQLVAGTLVERMPEDWDTAGTTGYDVLGLIDRVLTDPGGEQPLTELEARLRGGPVDWHAMVHDAKRAVADGILNSEVRRIVRDVVRTGGEPRGAADPAQTPEPAELVDAVAELLACFPVYRSYLPFGVEHLDVAFAEAAGRRPDLAPALDRLEGPLHDPVGHAALRFQQTSGMVMAKGVEDSSFYRWARLTSLDEVGGEPALFSLCPDQFHAAMAVRQATYPAAMTALSTHDTKRGEDVRARIAVLAERPEAWAIVLGKLLALAPLPDAGFGNLLWQAIVGAWPAGSEGGDVPHDLRSRLHAYAEKAMREAGDRTTWTEPDAEYEAAVHAAVDAAFDEPEAHRLLTEFVAEVAGPGWSNALAAKLLGLTLPGVPDVYQGSELWEQSLVDPDNRRPVDFEHRREALASLPTGEAVPLGSGVDDGALAKLQLTAAALRARRDRPELFKGYAPLKGDGDAANHVLAFDRGGAVTVVTRLPAGLEERGGWGDTTLTLPGRFRDAVTGRRTEGRVRVADLLADHPAALLVEDR